MKLAEQLLLQLGEAQSDMLSVEAINKALDKMGFKTLDRSKDVKVSAFKKGQESKANNKQGFKITFKNQVSDPKNGNARDIDVAKIVAKDWGVGRTVSYITDEANPKDDMQVFLLLTKD